MGGIIGVIESRDNIDLEYVEMLFTQEAKASRMQSGTARVCQEVEEVFRVNLHPNHHNLQDLCLTKLMIKEAQKKYEQVHHLVSF